ncbi:hypothetical protein GCM10025331_04850 [Actinoplanes utahensis]|uniref:hypothetical protein n=1 Tax=Actinoplanes utahensis TaxID=1869 RepID=UPI00068BEAEA|nr:hypothetical protein Aut01nite_12130 [Actinoplanes utahensis]
MRVFRTILGMVSLTTGLPALLAGGGLWAVMQHRDPGGAYSAELQRLTVPGYALVVPDVDRLLRDRAPFTRIGESELGLSAVTVDGQAFLGLAPSDEVARYLAGVPYSQVDGIDIGTGALPVSTQQIPGRRGPAAPPGTLNFWTADGTGQLAFNPDDLDDRPYSLVVMNPAARPVVRLAAIAEVRPGWLGSGVWGFLTLGTLLVMGGVIVLVWPGRRREVVYVVEPNQVPELMRAIGAPLPLPGGVAYFAGPRGGAHRPRTLADSRPTRPPALPQFAWPPKASAALPASTTAPAPGAAGSLAAATLTGIPTSPAPASSGAPSTGSAPASSGAPSAGSAPAAATGSPRTGSATALISGSPVGAASNPGVTTSVGAHASVTSLAGTHSGVTSPVGARAGATSPAGAASPAGAHAGAGSHVAVASQGGAHAGMTAQNSAPAGLAFHAAGDGGVASHAGVPAVGAPAGAATPAPGQPLSLIGDMPATSGLHPGPVPARRGDHRRPTAGDLGEFRATAVGAWVAATAPERARQTEARAAARLAEAARRNAGKFTPTQAGSRNMPPLGIPIAAPRRSDRPTPADATSASAITAEQTPHLAPTEPLQPDTATDTAPDTATDTAPDAATVAAAVGPDIATAAPDSAATALNATTTAPDAAIAASDSAMAAPDAAAGTASVAAVPDAEKQFPSVAAAPKGTGERLEPANTPDAVRADAPSESKAPTARVALHTGPAVTDWMATSTTRLGPPPASRPSPRQTPSVEQESMKAAEAAPAAPPAWPPVGEPTKKSAPMRDERSSVEKSEGQQKSGEVQKSGGVQEPGVAPKAAHRAPVTERLANREVLKSDRAEKPGEAQEPGEDLESGVVQRPGQARESGEGLTSGEVHRTGQGRESGEAEESGTAEVTETQGDRRPIVPVPAIPGTPGVATSIPESTAVVRMDEADGARSSIHAVEAAIPVLDLSAKGESTQNQPPQNQPTPNRSTPDQPAQRESIRDQSSQIPAGPDSAGPDPADRNAGATESAAAVVGEEKARPDRVRAGQEPRASVHIVETDGPAALGTGPAPVPTQGLVSGRTAESAPKGRATAGSENHVAGETEGSAAEPARTAEGQTAARAKENGGSGRVKKGTAAKNGEERLMARAAGRTTGKGAPARPAPAARRAPAAWIKAAESVAARVGAGRAGAEAVLPKGRADTDPAPAASATAAGHTTPAVGTTTAGGEAPAASATAAGPTAPAVSVASGVEVASSADVASSESGAAAAEGAPGVDAAPGVEREAGGSRTLSYREEAAELLARNGGGPRRRRTVAGQAKGKTAPGPKPEPAPKGAEQRTAGPRKQPKTD